MGSTRTLFVLAVVFIVTGAAFAGGRRIPEMSYICIEADTGLVVSEHHADIVRPPASMVKMMQFLMVAEGMEAGRWDGQTEIVATRHAQRMGGTQVFLAAGDAFSLAHLMEAVSVASANDAAMAVAEGLWGSEAGYLTAMNERAAEIGMSNTQFHSVHGLPPDRGEEPDATTARDMARLARYCVGHPQILEWSSRQLLRFRPEQSLFRNTNALLGKVEGLDGLKTGYIYASGFCITATAERNGIRLIAVVMGHRHGEERFRLAEKLLEDGFREVRRERFVEEGDSSYANATIANCETTQTRLLTTSGLSVTLKAKDLERVEVEVEWDDPLEAPLTRGQVAGHVSLVLDEEVLARTDLVVPQDFPEAPWTWKLAQFASQWLGSAANVLGVD